MGTFLFKIGLVRAQNTYLQHFNSMENIDNLRISKMRFGIFFLRLKITSR